MGKSVQPVIALVNLMKDPSRFTNDMDVDRAEITINGLKVLRLLTSEKPNAQKLTEDYNLCIKHVLDVLEEQVHNRSIKEEGRDTITNITRYQVVDDDVKLRIQKLYGVLNRMSKNKTQADLNDR